MKKKRALYKVSIIVLMLVVISSYLGTGPCFAQPTKKVFELKAQSWGGPTYPPRVQLENLIKRLEASGQFKVKYFPGETLMSIRESFDAVRKGVLDITISGAGYHEDRLGIIGAIAWMPGNFDFEKWVAHSRESGSYYDFAQPYYEKLGLRLLTDQKTPGAQLFSKVPIRTLEDTKGVMIRDAGGMAKWLKLLGFTPVGIKPSEFYEGVQRGVVEGVPVSLSNAVSNKWHEVCPYILMFDWFCSGQTLQMNLDLYKSWPSNVKNIFDQALIESEKELWILCRKQDDEDKAFLQKQGCKLYSLPKEEKARWEAAMAPLYQEYSNMYGDAWPKYMRIREKLK